MAEIIRFTRHAEDKFKILQMYGFSIKRSEVEEAIRNPVSKIEREGQILVLKPIGGNYALRVIYEKRGSEITIITFYPVKGERYGI